MVPLVIIRGGWRRRSWTRRRHNCWHNSISQTVNLNNGARINTASSGIGNSGNINLNINGSLQATDSFVSTSSTESSGGNLTIAADNIQLRGESDITTNIVSGEGSGGNIAITPIRSLLLMTAISLPLHRRTRRKYNS